MYNFRFLLCFVFLFFADIGSKMLSERFLSLFQATSLIPGVFDLQLVHNYGAAYGLFQYHRGFLLGVAVVVVVICTMLFFSKSTSTLMKWGLIVLLAGALGNFSDRLFLGYVVDFIDIKLFPVFNFADMFINAGIGLMLWDQFVHSRQQGRS